PAEAEELGLPRLREPGVDPEVRDAPRHMDREPELLAQPVRRELQVDRAVPLPVEGEPPLHRAGVLQHVVPGLERVPLRGVGARRGPGPGRRRGGRVRRAADPLARRIDVQPAAGEGEGGGEDREETGERPCHGTTSGVRPMTAPGPPSGGRARALCRSPDHSHGYETRQAGAAAAERRRIRPRVPPRRPGRRRRKMVAFLALRVELSERAGTGDGRAAPPGPRGTHLPWPRRRAPRRRQKGPQTGDPTPMSASPARGAAVHGMLGLATFLAACGDPSGPSRVATIVLDAPTTELAVGGTVQLSATVRDRDGNLLTDEPVRWSTSNPAVVSVNAAGLATAVAPGSASVTASADGRSASAQLTVYEAPPEIQLGETVIEFLATQGGGPPAPRTVTVQ